MWHYLLVLTSVFQLTWLFLWVRRRNNYWKDRNVFYRKSHPILGEFKSLCLRKMTLAQHYDRVYNAHTDQKVVGIHEFLNPKLFIRDPQIIGQILVKDYNCFHARQRVFHNGGRMVYSVGHLVGDKWKNSRRRITSVFSASKLKQVYPLIEECAETLMQVKLRSVAKTRQAVDIKDIMGKFTLDTIGKCAFGVELDTLRGNNLEFIDVAKSIFHLSPTNCIRFMIQQINPDLIKWIGMNHVCQKTENFMFDLLRRSEILRRKEINRRNDIFQVMLDYRDEEQERYRNGEIKEPFSDKHIASNMLQLYTSGQETTATTLTFLFYELALNPYIQDRLRNEINAISEKYGGRIDIDSLKECTYLEMVMSETLRMHGPAPGTVRRCNVDRYVVEGTPAVLTHGDTIILSISAIHYDEKYYPNPYKFDPERFTPENIAKRPLYTYLPFGDGPRICMGVRFAIVNIKCCVISILPKYRFLVSDQTKVPELSKTAVFRVPKDPVWLAVEKI